MREWERVHPRQKAICGPECSTRGNGGNVNSEFEHDVDNLGRLLRDIPNARSIPPGFALSEQTAEQFKLDAERAVEAKVWDLACEGEAITLSKLETAAEMLAGRCVLLVVDRETTQSLTTPRSSIPEFHNLSGGWVPKPAFEGAVSDEQALEARQQAEAFLRSDKDYSGTTPSEMISLLRSAIEYFAYATLYVACDRARQMQLGVAPLTAH